MRIDDLLNDIEQQQEIDYSKFTDGELDRIIAIYGERDKWEQLSGSEQTELESMTKTAMQR